MAGEQWSRTYLTHPNVFYAPLELIDVPAPAAAYADRCCDQTLWRPRAATPGAAGTLRVIEEGVFTT